MPLSGHARLVGIATALAVASCASGSISPPAPQARAAPDPTSELAWPAVVHCTRRAGPARPLYPIEVSTPFCRSDRTELLPRYIESVEQRLADEPDPVMQIALLAELAQDHLLSFEIGAITVCIRASEPTTQAELDELPTHLDAALARAAQGIELTRSNTSESTNDLFCVHTIAASRIGQLDLARASATALIDEAPCTLSALVEYGHAREAAGGLDEAREVFERAARIAARAPTLEVACPVAGVEPGFARIEEICDPNLFRSWCGWTDYLRYRLIWSAHFGDPEPTRTAAALAELATTLNDAELPGHSTLLDAIEVDREALSLAR